jgi:carbamoyl-phosphate synthase small subunit
VGVIGPAEQSDGELIDLARSVRDRVGRGLVRPARPKTSRCRPGKKGRVAVVDFGVKESIVSSLRKLGVETIVFGAEEAAAGGFDAGSILSGNFDAVVISNGPGDPADVPGAVESLRKLVGKIPILGICLGHQIAALALGGATYKLKFGHRGANQPVVHRGTGRIFITSQNHGYAVCPSIVERDARIRVTYTNLNDGTIEGFADDERLIECVQFHPEASPGPHDTAFIFDEFLSRVEGWGISSVECRLTSSRAGARETALDRASARGDARESLDEGNDACVSSGVSSAEEI